MDLDMFKLVNDSCGHIAGDELLRQVAWLFLSLVRRSDTVARIGGDEFALLMRACSTEHALEVAEALRAAIEAYRFRWDEKIFSIGLSVGVHKIDHSSVNVAAVLSAADTACYMAKEYGRNRIHLYSHCDEKVRQRSRELHWVKRLQGALDERRFRLFAQPIASLKPKRNSVQRYEILLRMVDENDELVSPKVFLPAAERFGMSMRLDRYVISWTLEWLARYPRDPDRPLVCAINVSGFSLGSSEFLEHVIGELRRTKVPASMVCIEITETAAIANFSSAQRFIQMLKAEGCRFALDDFGSGLTSFAYLKNLPVDFLKFDGLYARDILKDPINHALVKAMNHIAQMMGLQTIAEFVESEAVCAELAELGLDYAQGYFIGRPCPIEEAIK
jgi:Amt family ammonium transporter